MLRNTAIFVCLLFCVFPLSADVFSAAELRLSDGEMENTYQFTAQLPTSLASSKTLQLPSYCQVETVNQQRLGSNTILSYEFACTDELGDGAEIITPWCLDGANLRVNTQSSNFSLTLKRSLNTMVVPMVQPGALTLSKGQTIKRYLWQGMLHIWFGWDHLAFVLCLCLLARGYKLLGLVSTFTLAHSLTLALSYFELVTLPIAPVEVLIALSICLMAREAILCNRNARKVAMTASLGVVALFGLIHGLGFASALGELGVPQNEITLALLFFNIGVEVGQVVFIGVIYAVGALFTKTPYADQMRYSVLMGVGTLGMFWVIERINGFGGGII